MHEALSFALVAIPSLLVIINPLMVTSVFLTLTASYPPEARRKAARKTSTVAFAVLLAFAVFGSVLFRVFSITIGAFQIAGGIILFSVALGMLHAQPPRLKQTPEELEEAMRREDIAIVPLAIPMVSGPGAITTVIVLSGEAKTLAQHDRAPPGARDRDRHGLGDAAQRRRGSGACWARPGSTSRRG